MKDVFSKTSLDEVIDHVISNEVSELMRGSHTDQTKFVESNLNVAIIAHYERWPNFVEIFERRNLVAHGNLVVNELYIRNCVEVKYTDVSKLAIGDTLRLTPRYLRSAVDTLTEFGILLIFALWRKHIPLKEERAFSYLNDASLELISARRPKLAKRLLEFAVKLRKGCSDEVYRMMIVNLANSHKKLKDDEGCLKVLDSVDWSASRDDFQICAASLRGDVDKFIHLLPKIAAAETMSARNFREWPVFDWLREDKRVALEFERIFGEPLTSSALTSVSDSRVELDDRAEISPSDQSMTRH